MKSQAAHLLKITQRMVSALPREDEARCVALATTIKRLIREAGNVVGPLALALVANEHEAQDDADLAREREREHANPYAYTPPRKPEIKLAQYVPGSR